MIINKLSRYTDHKLWVKYKVHLNPTLITLFSVLKRSQIIFSIIKMSVLVEVYLIRDLVFLLLQFKIISPGEKSSMGKAPIKKHMNQNKYLANAHI